MNIKELKDLIKDMDDDQIVTLGSTSDLFFITAVEEKNIIHATGMSDAVVYEPDDYVEGHYDKLLATNKPMKATILSTNWSF